MRSSSELSERKGLYSMTRLFQSSVVVYLRKRKTVVWVPHTKAGRAPPRPTLLLLARHVY